MRYKARYNGVAYVVTDTTIPWDISAHFTMEDAIARAEFLNATKAQTVEHSSGKRAGDGATIFGGRMCNHCFHVRYTEGIAEIRWCCWCNYAERRVYYTQPIPGHGPYGPLKQLSRFQALEAQKAEHLPGTEKDASSNPAEGSILPA